MLWWFARKLKEAQEKDCLAPLRGRLLICCWDRPVPVTGPKVWQDISGMTATKANRAQESQTRGKDRTEPPWDVILHNDWENSMARVVVILKKVVPGMTVKRATQIMWQAHSSGQAIVKRCHKELAELYKERLQEKGLTATIEPAC